MKKSIFIHIEDCRVENRNSVVLPKVSWEMAAGEVWLVTGANGSGKQDFLKALAGERQFVPNELSSSYSSVFGSSVEMVSMERAASLIEEERRLDESEYTEGGVDIGRTGRAFICEALAGPIKRGGPLPDIAARLEAYPQIKLCGVERILERGLKYMSTGEIRRTMLARALVSGKALLILSDPFAGLDAESRRILLDFFNTISIRQRGRSNAGNEGGFPTLLLCLERYSEIPKAVTHVLEFSDRAVSFCGLRKDYESVLERRESSAAHSLESSRKEFAESVEAVRTESRRVAGAEEDSDDEMPAAENAATPLIEMHGVNVGWNGTFVLRDFTWTLQKGEHWLIRGPNGSGKTTFLELITGDNMQVFCNDVRLFGSRRGTGETVWDIRRRLGIVSYRLHVEYRMLGGCTLRDVVISGFHDSIGLYESHSDIEAAAAEKWLSLGGFSGRGSEGFGRLSYGEQRAVLILRAAVKCPEIMILDEPCQGLDGQFCRKILDLLEIIAESRTTTLLHVTHELFEVLPCERHILELHPGENPMYKILEL